jgi:hypothetical protein
MVKVLIKEMPRVFIVVDIGLLEGLGGLGFDLLIFALQYHRFRYGFSIETEISRLSLIKNGKY